MAMIQIDDAVLSELKKDAQFIRWVRRALKEGTNVLVQRPQQTVQMTIDPLLNPVTRNGVLDSFNRIYIAGPIAKVRDKAKGAKAVK